MNTLKAQTYECNSTTYSSWNRDLKDYEDFKVDTNATTFTLNNFGTYLFRTINSDRTQYDIVKKEMDSKIGLYNDTVTYCNKAKYVYNFDEKNTVVREYHEKGKKLVMRTYTMVQKQ